MDDTKGCCFTTIMPSSELAWVIPARLFLCRRRASQPLGQMFRLEYKRMWSDASPRGQAQENLAARLLTVSRVVFYVHRRSREPVCKESSDANDVRMQKNSVYRLDACVFAIIE